MQETSLIKNFSKILLAVIMLSFLSCNKLEYSNLKSIDIYDYQLKVPAKFQLIEEQGIDSYVGKLVGEGIEIQFDYGIHTSPSKNLDQDKFNIYFETFGSVERQIVVPKNPNEDFTSMHIRDLNDFSDMKSYVSLKMYTNNITRKEQDLVVKIFESTKLK